MKKVNRRHTLEFKVRLCQEIRSGAVGRREAGRRYRLSDQLVHHWLQDFDRGLLFESGRRDAEACEDPHATCRAYAAALQRRIQALAAELEARTAEAPAETSVRGAYSRRSHVPENEP
jgi:transposase